MYDERRRSWGKLAGSGAGLGFLGGGREIKRLDSIMNLASSKLVDTLVMIDSLDGWHFLGVSILGAF
jgi:hypothetical protein